MNNHCHKLNITNIPHQMMAFLDSSPFLLLRYIRFFVAACCCLTVARPTSSGGVQPLAIFAWTQVLGSCCSPEMSVFSTFSPWDRASHRKKMGMEHLISSDHPHFLDVGLNFKSMASRQKDPPWEPSQVADVHPRGRKKKNGFYHWISGVLPFSFKYIYIYIHDSL